MLRFHAVAFECTERLQVGKDDNGPGRIQQIEWLLGMGARKEGTGSVERAGVAQVARVRVEMVVSIFIVNEARGKGAGRRQAQRMTE